MNYVRTRAELARNCRPDGIFFKHPNTVVGPYDDAPSVWISPRPITPSSRPDQ
jgi:hypothetical protein